MKQMNDKLGRGEQGFTLIEVLVAIALFGILLAVLIPSITALLGINRQGERQLGSTTQAQQVIESVKGAWQPAITQGMTPEQRDNAVKQAAQRFDTNCAPGLTLPADVKLQSQPLDSRAGSPGALADIVRPTTCPTPPATMPPAMRRVQVSAGSGPQATILTLDVLRPQ